MFNASAWLCILALIWPYTLALHLALHTCSSSGLACSLYIWPGILVLHLALLYIWPCILVLLPLQQAP